jgi:hypothetical protein
MRTRTAAGARAKSSKKARAARASSNAAPVLASKLAKALAALARELPNPADESTDFFRSFVAPMPPDSRLDAGTFQQALKIGGRYKVALSSADALLSGAGDPDNSGEEIAQGFRLLEKVMRATLSELSVAFARAKGVVRVRMWLFGRSDDGTLVGLRSTSTET